MQIADTIERLRSRLYEYRKLNFGINPISTHINAIDIVLSLTELGIYDKRQISKEEESWFRAGLYLSYVFDGSKWEDIVTDFNSVVSFVENQKFFRTPTPTIQP